MEIAVVEDSRTIKIRHSDDFRCFSGQDDGQRMTLVSPRWNGHTNHNEADSDRELYPGISKRNWFLTTIPSYRNRRFLLVAIGYSVVNIHWGLDGQLLPAGSPHCCLDGRVRLEQG